MHIKTIYFYKVISADADKWSDASDFDKNNNRPLEIGKNKKVLGKFKVEIGGKIKTNFCALRAKTHSFLIDGYKDDDYEKNKRINKKAKGTKKYVIKREILFNNYADSLFKKNEMLLKNKVMYDQVKHRLETDDYLSALMGRSKNFRRNISIYNDKLKSIYSKLLMVTHTSDFI